MFDYISGVTVECKGPLIPLDVNNYLGRFNFFAKINQVRQHTFTKYTWSTWLPAWWSMPCFAGESTCLSRDNLLHFWGSGSQPPCICQADTWTGKASRSLPRLLCLGYGSFQKKLTCGRLINSRFGVVEAYSSFCNLSTSIYIHCTNDKGHILVRI